MKHLCGGEGVAVAVSRHLASSADVVVADGSPPDYRRRVDQLPDQLVDGVGVDAVVEFGAQSAVPALDQVDDVHHHNERHRDVDVAVVADVDETAVAPAHVGACRVQLAPGERRQTAGHEQAEHEALPVTLTAQ